MPMKTSPIYRLLALLGLASLASTTQAHHSFAMFDLTQHRIVEGRVTDWHFNSPHSWLYIEAPDENGDLQTWSFEGAAPIHAIRQGVTGNTFAKGEQVRVVMSPLQDGRNAGALCFVIKEDNSFAQPNDGICDAQAAISRWQSNGWLDSEHLDIHPASD